MLPHTLHLLLEFKSQRSDYIWQVLSFSISALIIGNCSYIARIGIGLICFAATIFWGWWDIHRGIWYHARVIVHLIISWGSWHCCRLRWLAIPWLLAIHRLVLLWTAFSSFCAWFGADAAAFLIIHLETYTDKQDDDDKEEDEDYESYDDP